MDLAAMVEPGRDRWRAMHLMQIRNDNSRSLCVFVSAPRAQCVDERT